MSCRCRAVVLARAAADEGDDNDEADVDADADAEADAGSDADADVLHRLRHRQKIATAATAITIATCHHRRSYPQDDRPSGLWPLALLPIAIHAAVHRHCSLLLLQLDAAELRAMTSPFAHDRAMINA